MNPNLTTQINLLEELVSFDTSEGNIDQFKRSFELINSHLSPIGLRSYKYLNNGIMSQVWSNSINHLQPDILLSAHVDVVPANSSQFKLRQENNRLYGRGVSDMKFSIVSYINILEQLFATNKFPSSIAVMITSDEEASGLYGTGYLVDEIGYRPKLVILPDAGEDLVLVSEAKGVLTLKVTALGTPAHSAHPWEGESAIDNLVDFLTNIRTVIPNPKSNLWENTVNIGTISGGIQANQICDHAEVLLDIRYTSSTLVEELVSKIESISSKISIEITNNANPFSVDISHPALLKWKNVVESVTVNNIIYGRDHGTSDARFFSPHHIPVIMTKPLAFGDHSPDEWLDINSWQILNQCLTKFLCS